MEQKYLWASKTFWGALIALLSTVLQMAGYNILSVEEQTQLIDQIISFIAAGGDLIGFILIIWGRIVANTKVVITKI